MRNVTDIFRIGTRAWEARIKERNPIRDASSSLVAAHLTLRRLAENISSFWLDRSWSDSVGLEIALSEIRGDRRRLNLILVARYLWFTSRLMRSGVDARCSALARESYELLLRHFLDRTEGGFFWEVDVDGGGPLKPDKHLYGQAFAVYALAEHGCATKHTEALALASQTFDLLETHAHDEEFGGYAEYFTPNWGRKTEQGYLGWDGDLKSMNTHLHLLEAFTGLYEGSPGVSLKSRIVELIDIVSRKAVSARHGVALDRYSGQWVPLTGRKHEKVSYGHELECIHLVLSACRAVGLSPNDQQSCCGERFAYSMRFGFDFIRGGFYKHGQIARPANQKAKIWWVQAEALLAALVMYRLTGVESYLSVFHATLEWISSYQVDWEDGEWHQEIDSRGRARGEKVGCWKGPYHTGRSILGCLDEIDKQLSAESSAAAEPNLL